MTQNFSGISNRRIDSSQATAASGEPPQRHSGCAMILREVRGSLFLNNPDKVADGTIRSSFRF
jgi:hypothetical protein